MGPSLEGSQGATSISLLRPTLIHFRCRLLNPRHDSCTALSGLLYVPSDNAELLLVEGAMVVVNKSMVRRATRREVKRTGWRRHIDARREHSGYEEGTRGG